MSNLPGDERGCVNVALEYAGPVTKEELFEIVSSALEDMNDRPGKGKLGKAAEKGGKTVRPPCPGVW
jgi:hypothetical protein